MKTQEAMAKAAPKKASKKKKGAVTRINIEIAENGFMVSCTHDSNSKEPTYEPPEQYVFASPDEAADFVREALGGSAPTEESGEDDDED